MVKLGARVDLAPKPTRDAVERWKIQFAVLWMDLECDVRGAEHHRKRIQTIEKRLQDSAYLREHSVSAEAIVEAENAVALHRSGLEMREARIQDRIVMFPEFWRGRPAGVDEWLRSEFFAYGDDDVVVCAFMLNQGIDSVWKEVQDQWERRGAPVNEEECPF